MTKCTWCTSEDPDRKLRKSKTSWKIPIHKGIPVRFSFRKDEVKYEACSENDFTIITENSWLQYQLAVLVEHIRSEQETSRAHSSSFVLSLNEVVIIVTIFSSILDSSAIHHSFPAILSRLQNKSKNRCQQNRYCSVDVSHIDFSIYPIRSQSISALFVTPYGFPVPLCVTKRINEWSPDNSHGPGIHGVRSNVHCFESPTAVTLRSVQVIISSVYQPNEVCMHASSVKPTLQRQCQLCWLSRTHVRSKIVTRERWQWEKQFWQHNPMAYRRLRVPALEGLRSISWPSQPREGRHQLCCRTCAGTDPCHQPNSGERQKISTLTVSDSHALFHRRQESRHWHRSMKEQLLKNYIVTSAGHKGAEKLMEGQAIAHHCLLHAKRACLHCRRYKWRCIT